jgi:hypothetical protein
MQKKPTLTYGEKIALAAGTLPALAMLPTGAEATIIYHSGSISSPATTGSVTWDVDGAGGGDFRLQNSASYAFLGSNGLNGRGLVQEDAAGHSWTFMRLPNSEVIGPALAAGYRFSPPELTGRYVIRSSLVGGSARHFSGGVPGYFGFRFNSSGNTLYGWAELTILSPSANQFTINRWAYNDTPNGTICVGQTSGIDCANGSGGGSGNPVPEPSTLSLTLLGMGAGGVRAWRKRKAAQALAA